MRLLGAGFLLLGLMALPLPALAQDAPPAPIARPDPGVTTASFPGGVTARFDVPYSTLNPPLPGLTLDLYVPPAKKASRQPPAPYPMVVFVHGGGWKTGDSRHNLAFADFARVLAGLAAQGYVVASVNYRLSPAVHFPAPLQDVKAAIRWMRIHAAENGGDVTRVAVWGASAGAHLAMMAGLTCGVMAYAPEGPVTRETPGACAEAVIDWFGPTDLGTPLNGGSGATEEGAYLGCEPASCAPGVVQRASPLSFITVNAPPFLIQQGADDVDPTPKTSQALYDALRKKGVPAEIEIYPGVSHGFFKGNGPDKATADQAMARLVSFLAATFPPAPAKSASQKQDQAPKHRSRRARHR